MDPLDGRSANAVLRSGRTCKGDLVMFNIDNLGTRALGKVQTFHLFDDMMMVYLIQFQPGSRIGHKMWDTSRGLETIVPTSRVIGAVPYKWLSDTMVRIIEPALL